MDQLLQHLVNAVVLGGTYALLGIGLTLIFGIMRVVNFTHGELYAFGAYTVYLVAAALGLNFFVGLAAAGRKYRSCSHSTSAIPSRHSRKSS